MESRRVSERVHGGGWGDCPQRKSSRDPTLSGSHSRNEAAGVCCTSLDIFMIKPRKECFLKTPTVNSFSCWHCLAYLLSKSWNCVCIGSANIAIFLQPFVFAHLSPQELPGQWIGYCQSHYAQYNVYIIYGLLYWSDLWTWLTHTFVPCVPAVLWIAQHQRTYFRLWRTPCGAPPSPIREQESSVGRKRVPSGGSQSTTWMIVSNRSVCAHQHTGPCTFVHTETYFVCASTPGSALTECYFTSSAGLENNRRSWPWRGVYSN